MIKKGTIIILIIFILTSLTLIINSKEVSNLITSAQITKPVINTLIRDQGEINILFCPQENCVDGLINFFNHTHKSLDCAFYELNHPQIIEKILNLEKDGIDVRIIIDNQYIEKFNHSFVKKDKSGYMHNKFCISDKSEMFTGSANPTINGLEKNNNNLLIINSSALITNYQNEFEELWNETFKKGDKTFNQNIILETSNFGEVKMKNYFCPEDNCVLKIDQILTNANSEIKFMMFAFTHDDLINTLLVKNIDQVLIEGIIEARMVHNSPYQLFSFQNISIKRDSNGNTMHHKVFVIDKKVVITGSFNPSENGNTNNDENVLILENQEIAKLYLEEFEKVYSLGRE